MAEDFKADQVLLNQIKFATLYATLTAANASTPDPRVEGNIITVRNPSDATKAKYLYVYQNGQWKQIATINSGILTITAGENEAAGILLESDEADDAGDSWKIYGAAPSGATAVLTPTMSGNAIQSVAITSAGSGYANSAPFPTVTVSGGGGSGAVITVTAMNGGGGVNTIAITQAGSGYSGTPTLTVSPPNGSHDKLVFANDKNAQGVYVEHASLIPNATVLNSTAAFAGSVTVAKDATIEGNLTVNGTTTTVNTTETLVKDKLITINDGGAASSAGGSGIEFEEDGSATGFIKTASDRAGFEFQAPANSCLLYTSPSPRD